MRCFNIHLAIFAFWLITFSEIVVCEIIAREDIETFSKDPIKVAKLRAAVAVLQSKPLTDRRSWINFSGIHGLSMDNPKITLIPAEIQLSFGKCHLNPNHFFAWHRAYVESLEKILQEAINDKNFRLPYWDWYSNPRIPEIFRNEYIDASHTTKNSLYISNRNEEINLGKPVRPSTITTNFNEGNFIVFQASLSSGEHGDIHTGVGTGKNMGHPLTAAQDPLFFVHHANVDRLLISWMRINNHKIKNPTQWMERDYNFPSPLGDLIKPTDTELELNSLSPMGYFYAQTDPPALPFPELPARPEDVSAQPLKFEAANKIRRMALTAVDDEGVKISKGGTVVLKIPTSDKKLFSEIMSTPESSDNASIFIEVTKLISPPSGFLNYQVFLNIPRKQEKSIFTDHFIGTISFFDLENFNIAQRVKFPLSQAMLRNLKSAYNVSSKESEINISFVPSTLPDVAIPKAAVIKVNRIAIEWGEAYTDE